MLRRHIWTGMLGSLFAFMSGGVFFTSYGQQMGMQPYHFGLLSVMASLSMPLMLLSAAIEERFGARKYPWFMLAMMGRFALLPIALAAFLTLSPWAIIMLVAASVALGRLALPLWESWTWGYIPSDTFARFTARRSFWATLSTTTFALSAAAVVRLAPAHDRMHVLGVVFAVLFALGIIDLLFHVRIPEPPRRARPSRSLAKVLDAFRNEPFRNWLVVMCVWYFGLGIGGPFCVPYMMEELGFRDRFFTATLLSCAVPAAGALLTLPLWGRLADSRWRRQTIAVSTAVWACIPFFYYFATPGNVAWTMGLAWTIAGIFPLGLAMCVPLMTSRLSGADKTMPSALTCMATGSGFLLGSIVGTLIVRYYSVPHAFFVSGAARVTGAFLIFLVLVAMPAAQRIRSRA